MTFTIVLLRLEAAITQERLEALLANNALSYESAELFTERDGEFIALVQFSTRNLASLAITSLLGIGSCAEKLATELLFNINSAKGLVVRTNVPNATSKAEVQNMFDFGAKPNVYINEGVAKILFKDKLSVSKALALNGQTLLRGSMLNIQVAFSTIEHAFPEIDFVAAVQLHELNLPTPTTMAWPDERKRMFPCATCDVEAPKQQFIIDHREEAHNGHYTCPLCGEMKN